MAPGRMVALEALGFLLLLAVDSRASESSKNLVGVINLNTAAPDLLGLLPGIGPAKAKGIVAYRSRHPLRTVDELVRVKGIGRRMVRLLRPHLAISGPSTARLSGSSVTNAGLELAPPNAVPKILAIHRPICAPPVKTTTPHANRTPFAARIDSHANHCLAPQ